MRRLRRKWAGSLAAAVALLCGVWAVALAAPVEAILPLGNLIQNPGAEAGPGSNDGSTVPIPGWITANGLTAVHYGALGGFPTTANGAAIAGGVNFFAGGPNSPVGTGVQTVDVSGAGADLDGGGVQATLSGDLGGFGGQNDYMVVTASFLGASGAALGQVSIGPVTAADRKSVTELLPRSASAAVPKGTRTVQVSITATRFSGAYNDGYADNLSLTLSTSRPPPAPVLAKSVNVRPVSGRVFIKLPPGATLTAAGPVAGKAQTGTLSPMGQAFIPLTQARQIPVGSILDTTAGTVHLTTATASRANVQSGDFSAGIFSVLQQRKQRGLTVLNLIDAHDARQICVGAGKAQAARKRLSSTVLGLLTGSAHGRFTTRGRFSAATVRGTKWGVRNRCDGTLTRVMRGVVVVRDFRRHKNITVRAGKTYLAKAPGA